MAIVVVATAFVTEAISKNVPVVTSKSLLFPKPGRSEAPFNSSSYTNFPNDFSATSLLDCVTAIDAAGKARSAIAWRRMENADENCWSWFRKNGPRVGSRLRICVLARKIRVFAGYNRVASERKDASAGRRPAKGHLHDYLGLLRVVAGLCTVKPSLHSGSTRCLGLVPPSTADGALYLSLFSSFGSLFRYVLYLSTPPLGIRAPGSSLGNCRGRQSPRHPPIR